MFAELRYFESMVEFVPVLAAIMALSATASARDVDGMGRSNSTAMRFDTGTSVTVTVRARILRASASVGAGFGPPAPRLAPRRTTVSAADGRAVPALVYDFE